MSESPIFDACDLHQYLLHCSDSLRATVNQLDRDLLLNTDPAALASQLAATARLTPITLHDPVIIAEEQILTDVSHDPLRRGIGPGPHKHPIWTVTYAIPFEGNAILLTCRPNQHYTSPPRATLCGQEIHVRVNELLGDAARMKAAFDAIHKEIRQYIAWMNPDLARFNDNLAHRLITLIQKRRDTFLAQSAKLAALGTPVRPAAAPSPTYVVALPQKQSTPTPTPSISPASLKPVTLPDPTMAMNTYEHILGIIRQAGVAMERTPASFRDHTESVLRDHILATLNTHYSGTTAETFNREGRTDIMVRHEGRTLFIGECKMWTHAGAVENTIGQLQKYITWRDTKTALIIFCRQGAATMLDRIAQGFKRHSTYIRQCEAPEGSLRFEMKHPTDAGSTYLVTILLFHLPRRTQTQDAPVQLDPFHD